MRRSRSTGSSSTSSRAAVLSQTPITKDLVTAAEKSGWKKTGRYDEVIRLCGDFALAHPGRVRCVTFGGTPEGRPMVALVASEDGVLSPEDARAKGREHAVLARHERDQDRKSTRLNSSHGYISYA